MHKIKYHQLQGAVTIEGTERDEVSLDVGEILGDKVIEVSMGVCVNDNIGYQDFHIELSLEEAEAVLKTLEYSVNQLRTKKLAQAIKAVYKDPEPEFGAPTEFFFEKKARLMMVKYPEKVESTLAAYDQLLKDVND